MRLFSLVALLHPALMPTVSYILPADFTGPLPVPLWILKGLCSLTRPPSERQATTTSNLDQDARPEGGLSPARPPPRVQGHAARCQLGLGDNRLEDGTRYALALPSPFVRRPSARETDSVIAALCLLTAGSPVATTYGAKLLKGVVSIDRKGEGEKAMAGDGRTSRPEWRGWPLTNEMTR